MKKEQVIRPTDAKEYIGYQFEGLAETLEQFDYVGMAQIVRATQAIFKRAEPDQHISQNPDCILLNVGKTKS